ncbi:MAG: molybdopterin-dependent oxidoreductase [Chloroflexi bacterium]|nr:molybdopterin-dependent oxidoreductase [Chloroflexota bacterium]
MRTSRRSFLKTAAVSAGAVAFVGCQPPPREIRMQSRLRVAEDELTALENWYATRYRAPGDSAGYGIIVRVVEGRAEKIEGNPLHPVNLGKTGARAQAALQELYHPDRIPGPLKRTGERGAAEFTSASWDEGLKTIGDRLQALLAGRNAGQVAILTGPGDGFRGALVERFVQAFGARHLVLDPLPDTPVRAAARRALGADRLPELDIQNAAMILSFGADFLGTWLSPVHYAIQYGEFRQGRPNRGYLVQVEPRFSMTAASADEWIPVNPGSEGVLALSLAQVILAEHLDAGGGQIFGAALDAYEPERTARITGVRADRVRALARLFAQRRPALAIGGGPAGAQTNGSFNLAAILALNQIAGSVGRKGGMLFNPPPLLPYAAPTAQAAPLDTWRRLADDLRSGAVDTVLVLGADPVYGLPAELKLADALGRAQLVVSFAGIVDDTAAMADLILPVHLPLEDWGAEVPDPAPGMAVVTTQQPIVNPALDTRSFADVLLALAERLGGDVRRALPWKTGYEALQDVMRDLQDRIPGAAEREGFESFWNRLFAQGGWWEPVAGVAPGGAPALQIPREPPTPRFAGDAAEYPFHLIVFPSPTLGAGEGARLPWLQAAPDPVTTVVWQTWAEISPSVAADLGLREGDVVEVESPVGKIEVPVYINPAAPPQVVGIPLGQGHRRSGRYAAGRGANPMALLAPLADEETGALAWAATRVRLKPARRSQRLPKLEGNVEARQLEGLEVVPVTKQ